MASHLIAVLSAIGIASTGVAATPAVTQANTYSMDAVPSPSAIPVYRQAGSDSERRMCRKKKNRNMPACAAYWDASGKWIGGTTGTGLGASGAVLPALAASVGAVGLIIAIDNGSKN